jgi:hypothetical protein
MAKRLGIGLPVPRTDRSADWPVLNVIAEDADVHTTNANT